MAKGEGAGEGENPQAASRSGLPDLAGLAAWSCACQATPAQFNDDVGRVGRFSDVQVASDSRQPGSDCVGCLISDGWLAIAVNRTMVSSISE